MCYLILLFCGPLSISHYLLSMLKDFLFLCYKLFFETFLFAEDYFYCHRNKKSFECTCLRIFFTQKPYFVLKKDVFLGLKVWLPVWLRKTRVAHFVKKCLNIIIIFCPPWVGFCSYLKNIFFYFFSTQLQNVAFKIFRTYYFKYDYMNTLIYDDINVDVSNISGFCIILLLL